MLIMGVVRALIKRRCVPYLYSTTVVVLLVGKYSMICINKNKKKILVTHELRETVLVCCFSTTAALDTNYQVLSRGSYL